MCTPYLGVSASQDSVMHGCVTEGLSRVTLELTGHCHPGACPCQAWSTWPGVHWRQVRLCQNVMAVASSGKRDVGMGASGT